VQGAGTDANVFITLYGEKGSSTRTHIGGKKKDFERGNIDHFTITVLK
jgi:hypothetical protein